MPTLSTTNGRPSWAQELVQTDLLLLGLDDGSPAAVLDTFEQIDGVDLHGVTRCLDLLKAHPVVLHCGEPRALMVYSPATGGYAASFDGALDEDMACLTEAQAGLWLACLACEQGGLPDRVDHWCFILVAGQMLSGQDRGAIDAYLAQSAHPGDGGAPDATTGVFSPTEVYDRAICRAFWSLAARCQEGR